MSYLFRVHHCLAGSLLLLLGLTSGGCQSAKSAFAFNSMRPQTTHTAVTSIVDTRIPDASLAPAAVNAHRQIRGGLRNPHAPRGSRTTGLMPLRHTQSHRLTKPSVRNFSRTIAPLRGPTWRATVSVFPADSTKAKARRSAAYADQPADFKTAGLTSVLAGVIIAVLSYVFANSQRGASIGQAIAAILIARAFLTFGILFVIAGLILLLIHASRQQKTSLS